MTFQTRWLIRRDMPEILQIEYDSYEFPWDERAFVQALQQRGGVGLVVEHRQRVAGFAIYETHDSAIEITNLAVAHMLRRQGVGTLLINQLKGKLSPEGQKELKMVVGDDSLDAHCFLRRQEFRATAVLRNYYSQDEQNGDESDDAYLMRFHIDGHSVTFQHTNRISKHLNTEA